MLVASGFDSRVIAQPEDSFDSLLKRGFQLHQQSAYAQAIPLLERARRLQPQNYFVNLLLGIDLLRSGEAAQSVSRLRLAARVSPAEETPVEYLGEAEATMGYYASAAEAYQSALVRGHGSEEAKEAWADYAVERFRQIGADLRVSRQGLAVAYRLQSESLPAGSREQLSALTQATEADSSAPGIWSERGLGQFAAGDRGAAAASLEHALRHDSSDLQAWRLQALLSAAEGQWQGAARQLSSIGEHSPSILRQTLGSWPRELLPPQPDDAGSDWPWRFVREKNIESCIAPSHATLSKRRSNSTADLFIEQRWESIAALPAPAATQSQAWLERGIALASLHDCARAIPALERGLNANRSEGGYRLSVCYASEAGHAAEELQGSGQDPVAVLRLRGDVLLHLKGDVAAAATTYRTALKSRPRDPALLERLAEAQWSAGDAEAAKGSAQAALESDPHRIDATRILAHIAMSNRAYDEALPYLRQIAAAEPGDRSNRVELATACAQTSHPEEALHLLQPALQEGYPDEKGSLHAMLGQVFRTLGREQEAVQSFAQARSLSDAYQSRVRRTGDDQH